MAYQGFKYRWKERVKGGGEMARDVLADFESVHHQNWSEDPIASIQALNSHTYRWLQRQAGATGATGKPQKRSSKHRS